VTNAYRIALTAFALSLAYGCASLGVEPIRSNELKPEDRLAILRRAQVWQATNIPSMNLRTGPPGPGSFSPDETIRCEFVNKKSGGATPKFDCLIAPHDEIKIKFGRDNGEVYGEVAATRLLWALGFGADRMYPVRVICRGCPARLAGTPGAATGETIFDPAAAERKASGKTIETRKDEGWTWNELDLVDEAAGGAPRAQRDALKLLAVLIQHADNKAQQQRLSCLDKDDKDKKGDKEKDDTDKDDGSDKEQSEVACRHPFMLLNDLGSTFGRSDVLNRNSYESVNFDRWSQTPIWKGSEGCVGNLPKSLTGSFYDPPISEEGRQFLARLLSQLSDAQLSDLFDVARFTQRVSQNSPGGQHTATIADWVNAFKAKRREIEMRRCA
jgi:hypothetical protein